MRIQPVYRFGTLAVAAAAATFLAAGCSSGTPAPAGSGHAASPAAMTAAQVIQNVSSQATRATSATVIMDMQMTGKLQSSMHGVMKVRTTPDLAYELDLTNLTSAGHIVPGGLDEILTSNAIYLKMPVLARATGKPWVKMTAAQINSASGGAFSGLTTQIRQQDPLSAARMLGASKDVTVVGKATVGGVSTTHYHGTYPVGAAVSKEGPALRRLARQFATALGASTVIFDAWVDSQGHLRKVAESYDTKRLGHVTMSMLFTGINQPVSIIVPAASQVGSLPGIGG